MPYRLPPDVWRGLLCRAVLLDARAGQLGQICTLLESGSVVVEGVVNDLHQSARRACVKPSDVAAIAEAELLWQDKIDDAMAAAGLSSDETRVLTRLREPPLALSGDPFRARFEAVERLAAELFGAAWPSTSQLMVLNSIAHPRQTDDPYALTADARRKGAKVLVELLLYDNGLGPEVWLVLPMILVHESVCHVMDLARGYQVDNQSPFSEGMMDWAAHFYFQRWAWDLCAEDWAAATEQAERFRIASTAKIPGAVGARRLGWRAAELLVGQIYEQGIRAPIAEGLVANCAVRICCSARARPDARDVLVQDVEREVLTLADPILRKVLLGGGDADMLF